jgi:hypothetical protein
MPDLTPSTRSTGDHPKADVQSRVASHILTAIGQLFTCQRASNGSLRKSESTHPRTQKQAAVRGIKNPVCSPRHVAPFGPN